MLEITSEMKDMRAKRVREMEAKVDKHIQFAVERNSQCAYFACDKTNDKDVYDEIRRKYENAGYIIKPTGYSGGVWQLTEDICW